MKKEDIKVTVEQNVLTIEGERKFDSEVARDQYPPVGARIQRLPPQLHVAGHARRVARLRQLHGRRAHEVTLPQKKREAKPRQIEVNG